MTNYNERLDEAIKTIFNVNHKGTLYYNHDIDDILDYQDVYDAKQAITSLTKELVAEAKPSKKRVGDEVAENRSYTGERLFNATIDEFEQNLLKALEEV